MPSCKRREVFCVLSVVRVSVLLLVLLCPRLPAAEANAPGPTARAGLLLGVGGADHAPGGDLAARLPRARGLAGQRASLEGPSGIPRFRAFPLLAAGRHAVSGRADPGGLEPAGFRCCKRRVPRGHLARAGWLGVFPVPGGNPAHARAREAGHLQSQGHGGRTGAGRLCLGRDFRRRDRGVPGRRGPARGRPARHPARPRRMVRCPGRGRHRGDRSGPASLCRGRLVGRCHPRVVRGRADSPWSFPPRCSGSLCRGGFGCVCRGNSRRFARDAHRQALPAGIQRMRRDPPAGGCSGCGGWHLVRQGQAALRARRLSSHALARNGRLRGQPAHRRRAADDKARGRGVHAHGC